MADADPSPAPAAAADQEDVKPTAPPPQDDGDQPTRADSQAAAGRRAGSSSVAPDDGATAARKHGLDSSLILNEPRKRAKRESTDAAGLGGATVAGQGGQGGGHGKGKKAVHYDDPAFVLDKGMQLLDAVRGATEPGSLDGRLIATDFLKLPNRRLYPDYYEIIKLPVALDDIEIKIKASEYPSLDAVRADVEHCFVNAKRYNAKGSVIFNDAKILHKLAKTTYSHLVPTDHPDYKAPPPAAPPRAPTPPPPPPPPPPQPAAAPVASTSAAAAAAAPGAGDTASPAPKKGQNQHTKRREAEERARQLAVEAEAARVAAKPEKKVKVPDVWKTLKIRLDKVTQMKEKATGRVLAAEFMDLISKSDYPDYYKIIKKPISFNMIYQKLKRKDYESAEEFADDVDLIFSNALAFNMDESQIAIDSVALKEKFHSLVDELIAEGHQAPKGQAKVAHPAPSAGSGAAVGPSSSAPTKGKAAGANGANAPASLAKIKIKKKTKAEETTSQPAAEGLAAAAQAGGGQQPMDVDQPSSAAPAQSIDPTTLAALQQLITSGAFDVGTQQATTAGPSAQQLQQLQQSADPAVAAAAQAQQAAATAAAPPVPEKKLTRNEQRALNRELKAAKKAAAAAAKAAPPAPPQARPASQQPASYPLPQGYVPPQLSVTQPAATPAPPPPRVKLPSILSAFVLRFPGSDRREVRMRNDRGVKAHALSVLEHEVALEMDVRDLDKGKGRAVNGESTEEAAAANGAAPTADDADATGEADVDGYVDGGGHAQPLPPPPGLPKRLYAISVVNNAVPVESSPPAVRADLYVANPPTAFHLALPDAKGRAAIVGGGGGSWLVEVAVRWRDVDEQSGAVLDQGYEAYELFLRR